MGTSKNTGEWRCKVCKFNNDNSMEICSMCREEKQVLIETPVARGKPIVAIHQNIPKPKLKREE